MDVSGALEEDLDRVDVGARSSEFVLLVQNRFSVLDSTVRDTDDLTPTALDGGVEVFPMTDDATVQVPIEPPRRLVLIPQSQGTPRSVQDRQSDESERLHPCAIETQCPIGVFCVSQWCQARGRVLIRESQRR